MAGTNGNLNIGCVGAIALAIPVMMIWNWAEDLVRPPSPPSPVVQATKPPSHPSLLDDPGLAKKYPGMAGDVARVIRNRGFHCPAVTEVWLETTQSQYGLQLDVLCGPPGTRNGYVGLHYAVYPEAKRVHRCAPFTDVFTECQ